MTAKFNPFLDREGIIAETRAQFGDSTADVVRRYIDGELPDVEMPRQRPVRHRKEVPMNRQEAGDVFARIAAAYPNITVGADTAEVWFNSALSRVDYATGKQAAEELIAHRDDPRFPTPATYNAIVGMIRRRRIGLPPSTDTPADPDTVAASIARMRELLARSTRSMRGV